MYEKMIKLQEGFDFNKSATVNSIQSTALHDTVEQSIAQDLQKRGLAFVKQILQYELNCQFNYNRIKKYEDGIYVIENDIQQLIKDNPTVWTEKIITPNILKFYQGIIGDRYISDDKINNTGRYEELNESDRLYESSDGGVVILGITHVYERYKYLVLFTGKVNYKKKKSKELVKDKIPAYFLDYIFKKNLGDKVQKLLNGGFTQINDNNGYPQLVTVIRKLRSYSYKNSPIYWRVRRFPSLFFDKDYNENYPYKYRENWEKLPDSDNPSVLATKRSKDGLLMMGAVMPYDIQKIYKNKNWMFYDYSFGDRHLNREEEIKKSILNMPQLNYINEKGKTDQEFMPEITQMLGIYAYRLSDKGKQLYDLAFETFGNKGAISPNKIADWVDEQLNGENE